MSSARELPHREGVKSLQSIGLFYVIIHFIRSRINLLDLIIGNMASNNEGQGSGYCDDVYLAADEFLSLVDDQPMLFPGPLVVSGTETDMQTGAETETGAETQTGIGTGAKTETDAASGSGAGVEPKAKRQRVPNKLRTTRLVVTSVDDGNFEPTAPEEARACYHYKKRHIRDILGRTKFFLSYL